MKEKLQSLLKNSYAPYSKFPVAAVVEMKDGTMFYGVNVENASYGGTICAERNAIASAITNGYHKGDFASLTIMVDRPNFSTCCFLCRQVIVEFFDPDSQVTFLNNEGVGETVTVSALCPMAFSEDDLK